MSYYNIIAMQMHEHMRCLYECVCVCVYTYVCENDLWQCLDKNILSNGYCVLGGVTKIGSLTG
jgi:hypothetical protein